MNLKDCFRLWRIVITCYLTVYGIYILSTESFKKTNSKLSTKIQKHFLIYIIIDTLQSLYFGYHDPQSFNKETLIHHVMCIIGISIMMHYKCSPPLWTGLMCIIEIITVSRILLFLNIDNMIFVHVRKILTLFIRIPTILIAMVSIIFFWNKIPILCILVLIIMVCFLLCFDLHCLSIYNKQILKN